MLMEYKFYNCSFLKLSIYFSVSLLLLCPSKDFCILEVLMFLHKELTRTNACTIFDAFSSSENPLTLLPLSCLASDFLIDC